MTHVNQNRPFDQRLTDFGPELGNFLGRVWQRRAGIDISNFDLGTNTIYDMYAGASAERPYSFPELRAFLADLKALAKGYSVEPQGFRFTLDTVRDSQVRVYGKDLWTDFYHVLSTPSPAKNIRARVYVHAATPAASIQLMKLIVGQFGTIDGLWEVKTAGPGAQRLDTIVAYLYDDASSKTLIELLNKTAQSASTLFTDSLPPLIKRVGPGIGSADEPPAVEIFKGGGDRHSFGSFFSALCWVALKSTPNARQANADGRHMLDNVLFSLRALRVDPRNPQSFPEANALEQWYRASITS